MSRNTKERILNASMELFAQYGYDATSVRQICKKADVNVAMIKYYFGSKLSIYFSLLDSFFTRLHHFILKSGIIEEPDVKRKIAIAFEQGCSFARNNADMLLILTREIVDRKRLNEDLPMEKIVRILSEIWEQSVEDRFTGELFPGLPRDIASMILIGLIHVPVFYGRLFSELGNRPLEEFYKLYLDIIPKLFLHGLQSFIENKEGDDT